MEDDDSRYTKNLGRNLIIGLITVYPATVGLCFAAIGDLGQSAAIATVPAIFAGPYVGRPSHPRTTSRHLGRRALPLGFRS